MFFPFIQQSRYDKTNTFIIQGKIILYWLFFITFVIRNVPYIGWWRYVREHYLIIKIWFCYLDALLGHSRIVINFFHSWKITICQAKTSKTSKKNFDKCIAPFPLILLINLPTWYVGFFISINTDEFIRQYSGLKKFPHTPVSLHTH